MKHKMAIYSSPHPDPKSPHPLYYMVMLSKKGKILKKRLFTTEELKIIYESQSAKETINRLISSIAANITEGLPVKLPIYSNSLKIYYYPESLSSLLNK